MHSTAILCRSKHGDYQAAAKLIARRARELGVPNPLEQGVVAASAETMQLALAMSDFEGDPEAVALTRMTQESAARKARGENADTSEEIIRRHPEFSHLFKPGRTSKGKHPSKSGREVTSKTRAHAGDLEDDAQDHDQPAEGGHVHGEVDRYLRMREKEFGGESRRKTTGKS